MKTSHFILIIMMTHNMMALSFPGAQHDRLDFMLLVAVTSRTIITARTCLGLSATLSCLCAYFSLFSYLCSSILIPSCVSIVLSMYLAPSNELSKEEKAGNR